jgi:hypothetical protein
MRFFTCAVQFFETCKVSAFHTLLIGAVLLSSPHACCSLRIFPRSAFLRLPPPLLLPCFSRMQGQARMVVPRNGNRPPTGTPPHTHNKKQTIPTISKTSLEPCGADCPGALTTPGHRGPPQKNSGEHAHSRAPALTQNQNCPAVPKNKGSACPTREPKLPRHHRRLPPQLQS